jgi:lipoprotein-anchoring transpeptidase ErfK/SrfK
MRDSVGLKLLRLTYGVEGHVRHDQSYGCIRLTNWDAADLSHTVR